MKVTFTAMMALLFCVSAQANVSHSYAEVKAFMYDLATKHADTTKMFTLGESDSGEVIEGVQIGNGTINNLVVATHHGNEYGSTEVAKAFAESLAAEPIQGQTLFVIPVLNIDGYNHNERRETARGTTWDPNRNYPGPCGTEGPFTLKDTQALATFLLKQHVVTSATLHTFTGAVLYPWGISASGDSLLTGYEDTFKQIGEAAVVDSHYEVGNSTLLIYPADGAYEDYAFWVHGIWSMLFEIGDTHSPSDDQVAEWDKVNVPGLRRMFEVAPRTRAEKHSFTGKCDTQRILLDRHDE